MIPMIYASSRCRCTLPYPLPVITTPLFPKNWTRSCVLRWLSAGRNAIIRLPNCVPPFLPPLKDPVPSIRMRQLLDNLMHLECPLHHLYPCLVVPECSLQRSSQLLSLCLVVCAILMRRSYCAKPG